MSAQLSGWLAQAWATDSPVLPTSGAMQLWLHLGWSVVLACLGVSIAGGWFSSRLIQQGRTPNFARKVTMIIAGLCVLPLLFVTGVSNMWLAVLLIGIALAGHQAFSTNLLSIPPDMFPKRAVGSVIGLGGFAGGIGGMIMAKSTGLVLDATEGNYTIIFAMCTTVYFLAVAAIHLLSPRLAKVEVQ